MIIPIEEISDRYKEIPKDKDIVVVCPSGIRSNIVASFLKTKGIETKVLIGGLESLK
jgi:rhodanese-related sulfurtransferase